MIYSPQLGNYSSHSLLDNEAELIVSSLPLMRGASAKRARTWLWPATLVLQALVIVVLSWLLSHRTYSAGPHMYFPAESAVKFEIRTFTFGVNGDLSPYQGPPSPQLDQRWEQLYSVGFQRISKQEAAKLPNKTAPIPDDPEGFYVMELDVFHQLHCLNAVRKALYPAHYPDMQMGDPETAIHIDHCIDTIRQSLMCSTDISTVVWQWSDRLQKNAFTGAVAHKCRNFGMIQDWARERKLLNHFNNSVQIFDDIHIPIYHTDGTTSIPL